MSLYYDKELVGVIGKLREAFILDNVETSLFNPHNAIMDQAGVWAPFMMTLMRHHGGGKRGGFLVDRDIAWDYHYAKQPSSHRTTRWLNIKRLDTNLNAIVALGPAPYFNDCGKEYMDYRFAVFCDCDDFLVYSLFLKDYMMCY